MKDRLKISVIQMNSQADQQANLKQAEELMTQALQSEQPDLIVLPEYFNFYGGKQEGKLKAVNDIPGGPAYTFIQDYAKKNKVWIHAGSMMERVDGEERIHNTTIVFDRSGREIVKYRKIHLFDIEGPDGTKYFESATIKPGNDVITYDLEGFKVGCAICYDMRFAELFIKLAQEKVDIIVLPAAFTLQTGKDHWEVLLRARAIETQAYVAASAQTGSYLNDKERRFTYGHSLVCDPWGHVVAKASDGIGVVSTQILRGQIQRCQRLIPMMSHRRLSVTKE